MGYGLAGFPAKPGGFHRPACARGRGSRLCMAVRRQQCAEGVCTVRHVAGEYALGEKFPSRHLRQMPRAERAPLRFAAAAHMRGDLLVLECRSLNTPHAFEMRFVSSGDGMRMELFSPLDVFGEEKLLEAGRPQRKVER